MAKKFRDLVKATMSPEAQARASDRARAMLREMELDEIRRTAGLSQVEVARRAGTTQPEVSKIEGRRDTLLSTLRRYVRQGLGGELEIIVRLPDGTRFLLTQYDEPEAPTASEPRPQRRGRGEPAGLH